MNRPDYDAFQALCGFDWAVNGSQDAIRALAEVPLGNFNLNPDARIEVFRRGRPLHREWFGPDIPVPGVSTSEISYGHISCLGAECDQRIVTDLTL